MTEWNYSSDGEVTQWTQGDKSKRIRFLAHHYSKPEDRGFLEILIAVDAEGNKTWKPMIDCTPEELEAAQCLSHTT